MNMVSRIGAVKLLAAIAVMIALASTAVWQSTAQAQSTGICGRTLPVQTAILAQLDDVDACGVVTDSHLSGIDGSDRTLSVNFLVVDGDTSTTYSVASGDFSGLTGLTRLTFLNHDDSTLPEDIFDSLDSLETLDLSGSQLTTLSEDLFDGLDSLKNLRLGSNKLTTLPEDIFDGLDSLESLVLMSNEITTLPEDVFDGLSSLEWLSLFNNDLSSVPEGLFEGLSSLEHLELYENPFSTLPADLFDGLSNLEVLWLRFNSNLATLPEGIFDGLTSLKELDLYKSNLTSLPDGAFEGLTNLETVDFRGNPGPINMTFQHEVISTGVTTGTLVVKAAKGVPFDTSVTLKAFHPIFSPATVTIPAGGTQSEVVTLTRPDGSRGASILISDVGWARNVVLDSDKVARGIGAEKLSNNGIRWNTPPTGVPTISGTAQVGQTLTVDTSGINDVDVGITLAGVSFGYQWLADDTEIDGATSSTYTVQSSDVGKAIKAQVTFPNTLAGLEIEESVTSAETSAVVLGGL